jgi:hypothetical protein
LPIGSIARIKQPNDLDREAIILDDVLRDLLGRNSAITVVLLDACRNSPFTAIPQIQTGLARTVPPAQGLDRVHQQTTKETAIEGALIAYATAPNAAALDGVERNSPYSKHLKEYLAKPNISLEAILKLTRTDVTRETMGQQMPWYESSINGDYFPAGTDRISFDNLLKLFLPEPIRDRMPWAHYVISWSSGSDRPSPIQWGHAGLRTDDEREKIYDGNGSVYGGFFSRVGEVVITVDGHPTHTILEQTRNAARWKIAMNGPRAGAEVVEFSNDVVSHEFAGLGRAKFLDEDRTCRRGAYSLGSTVYRVKVKDRESGWLSESWSCGAVGCGYKYDLFLNDSDRHRYGCP